MTTRATGTVPSTDFHLHRPTDSTKLRETQARRPGFKDTFSALRVRNFRLLVSGLLVSSTGGWIQRIAQDWLVLTLTGSATAVGITTALQFLPTLVLGLYGSTSYTRYARGSMIESLSEDYVRTAVAKGLSTRAVTVRHALRSALVPVATIFGIDFAFLLAGTVFTEKIFQLEGIGKWGLDATYIRDLPVVQATSLVLAIAVVGANILVDILYSFLDPRVRLS